MSETPVVFQSQGQQIVGMLHVPETGKKPYPAVLFLHGFTGSRIESHRLFVLTARHLAKFGIASLRIDCRGSGDSEGDFSEMTIAGELDDAKATLQFLRARPEIDGKRIGILGMSMGGMVTAFLLAEEPSISIAVLWCPVGQPTHLLQKEMTSETQQQLATSGVADYGGWPAGLAFVKELQVLRPLDVVGRTKARVLLIHGDQDESVDLADTRAYEKALQQAGREVQVRVIKGANHTFDSLAWAGEVVEHSVAWLSCLAQH